MAAFPSRRYKFDVPYFFLANWTVFLCRLYQIKLGTLEMENSADTEWVLRPYMNTAKKKTTLSDVDGWEVDT